MSHQNPIVSVIVCSHNGNKTINSCLDSLKDQNYQSQKYEIIVIDNASTDNLKNTVKLIKGIKYYFEPQLGLSIARNRGVKQAKGNLIAFIDDDALADKNWLKNLVSQFKNQNVWAVGGKVLPKYQAKPPTWLPEKYLFCLSICDLGSKIKSVPYLVGTNMAFRKKVFSQIGYFNPQLGRHGNNLISAEELEFCHRITEVHGRIIYHPQAVVHHLIPPSRLTKKFFSRRIFNEGLSLAKFDKQTTKFPIRLRRLIIHRFKALITALIKLLIYRRFIFWCDLLLNLGYFAGFFLT